MFNLHDKYLIELREEKKHINCEVVKNYFNSMHPSKQMYALNYNMRKRNLDHLSNEYSKFTETLEKES